MTTKSYDIKSIKEAFSFIVAIVAVVAGVIFWVQNSVDEKVDRVERPISAVEQEIDKIRDNNNEILRIIGRLEGKLERRKRQ